MTRVHRLWSIPLSLSPLFVALLACAPPAPSGSGDCTGTQLNCGGTCVDVNTSAAHCGRCFNACNNTLVCAAGACECPSGSVNCQGECVNVTNNALNCGGCGRACAAGQVCNNSSCVASNGGPGGTPGACTTGQTECSGSCVNTQDNTSHCGGCGNACAVGQSCNTGVCGCGGGLASCGGACVNTQTDSNNCGGCGVVCSGGRTCVAGGGGGSCQCPSGTSFCGGACVNTKTSEAHCGGCGIGCGAGQVCVTPTGGASSCQANLPTPSFTPERSYPSEASAGQPTTITLPSTIDDSSTQYQCRTLPAASSFGGAEVGWNPCDGGSGTQAVFRFTYGVGATALNGMKKFQYRTRLDGKSSPPSAERTFYVHSSLDRLQRCPASPFTVDKSVVFENAESAILALMDARGEDTFAGLPLFGPLDFELPRTSIPFSGVRMSRMLRTSFGGSGSEFNAPADCRTNVQHVGTSLCSRGHNMLSSARQSTYGPGLDRPLTPQANGYFHDEVERSPQSFDPDWDVAAFDVTVNDQSSMLNRGFFAPLRHRYERNPGADAELVLITREWPARDFEGSIPANRCLSRIKMGLGASANRYKYCAGFVLAANGFGACVDAAGTVTYSTPFAWTKLIAGMHSRKCFDPGPGCHPMDVMPD